MKNLIPIIVFFCVVTCFSPAYTADESEHLIMNHPIKKVLLVVALEMEAEPIITKLGLHERSQSFSGLPMKIYDGKHNKLEIFLVTHGRDPIHKVQNIGTQPATLSTYLGISNFHPD